MGCLSVLGKKILMQRLCPEMKVVFRPLGVQVILQTMNEYLFEVPNIVF